MKQSLLAIPRKRPAILPGPFEVLSKLVRNALKEGRSNEESFEEDFAAYVGVKHAVCVAGARLGLWLLLEDIRERLGVGDVIVQGLTASIVPNIIVAAGFNPVFVDVDEESFTADAPKLLSFVRSETRAVIATHLEGFPVNARAAMEALTDQNIMVVEDAAHALGAKVGRAKVGSIGDAAIFSFGKGKQLNAISGGMVTTGDPDLARRLRMKLEGKGRPGFSACLSRYALVQGMRLATTPGLFDLGLWPGIRACGAMGFDPLTDFFEDPLTPPGENGPSSGRERLGGFQAGLGSYGLQEYPDALRKRKEIWKYLKNAATRGGIKTQEALPSTTPAPLEFAIRVRDRALAQRWLRGQGIDSQPTWMIAPSVLPAIQAGSRGNCVKSEALARELLYIPFYPALRDSEVEKLVRTLESPVHGICL